MRIAPIAFGLLLLSGNASNGKEFGGADAIEASQKQKKENDAAKPTSGPLSVYGLKVGAEGYPDFIDAKVMQVIDAKSMLVGLEDARTGTGEYDTWVMLKCNTAGI